MATSKLDQLKIDREPETQSRPVGAGVFVVSTLALVALAWWWWENHPTAIVVQTVVAREISNQAAGTVLNASGYVTARRQATVSSKVTAKVVEVLIEEGTEVEMNQVLARLDDSNVRASYALAEAQLRSSETARKETSALLKEARSNFSRSTNLVERGLASDAELDRSRALAESLTAQLERKQADIRVSEKQLDIYRLQIEDTIIRAPFAGVVVAKNAQPGEMISPISAGGGFTRTGIGTIVDMDSLEIEIDVNETYINRVSAGQKVVATLDAYPQWQIPSHVIAIVPTADRQRATVEVRVGFDQLDTRILPDMGVKVAFQDDGSVTSPGRAGVWVPPDAIIHEGDSEYVFVINNKTAQRRAVSTSGEHASGILVSSGISAGERIIINAPVGLENGAVVKETDG